MKPLKTDAESQLFNIERLLIEDYNTKNPPPSPPTNAQILKCVKAGKIAPAKKCSCDTTDFRYGQPAASSFNFETIFTVEVVEDFLSNHKKWSDKKSAAVSKISQKRQDLQNKVLYAGMSFLDALEDFKAFKV